VGFGGSIRRFLPGLSVVAVLLPAGCVAPGPSAAPVAEVQPAAFTPTEQSLLGADPAKLEQWLGKPGLVRQDDPAQVWQYRAPACVLDVYLYPGENGMAVAHAEARSTKYPSDPMSSCLTVLAEARRKATGS
jgi:hypothetical protein